MKSQSVSPLKDIIEYEDHIVEEAADGMEALSLIEKNDYDLIFCDIKMPKMDGVEVLEKALKIKDVKICMISGHGTISTAVECLKKGAIDYIEKPIDLNRLLKVLTDNLSNLENGKQELKSEKTKNKN